jgi:hypothetical protein
VSRVALVVPTNRLDSLAQFRRAWEGAPFDDVIVVYDGPRAECVIEWPTATVYCWEDHNDLHGPDGWIFSRRDSACRCLGFVEAVRRGADYVVTLDDDCLPLDDEFAASFPAEHVRRLEAPTRWVSTVPGLRVRGMPSGDDGVIDGPPAVLVNMGLWCGVPDLSAEQTLALRSRNADSAVLTDFTPAPGDRVASPHQLFPFCGMNLAFRRDALPALYFPKMGIGSPYSRFDDIWCGVLLQRICARTGHLLTIGEPWVRHVRASNVDENLRKEAPGVAAHERYWRILADLRIEGEDLSDCVLSAADGLEAQGDAYLVEWGRALRIWSAIAVSAAGSVTLQTAAGER